MKVGQSNTYADQACRPMTTTRTRRTGKNCRPAADPPTPKIAAKRKDIADTICLRKRNVPKICASTTGYLVFLRRSADCFTDKNGSPGKTRHANMCCMCRTPRPVDANQMDPPVPNPKFGTYISRGIPATRLLGRTPKAPPARLHSFLPSEGQFWSRFFGGIVLPTFRTDSSKRRNAPGGRRRARGWWRRCGRSWLLLRVRGCTTQHKRRNGRYKRRRTGGGGTRSLTFALLDRLITR